MPSASQEFKLIEAAMRETKQQLARRICSVGFVHAHKDKAIGRMIARLNELNRLKNAMKERANTGVRVH